MGERVFTIPPSKYVYLYNIYQDVYRQHPAQRTFCAGSADQVWHRAMDRQRTTSCSNCGQSLSLNDQLEGHTRFFFVLLCHHLTVTVIISCHNIFMSSKNAKTMTTNLHYILLFRLQNRLQLSTLGTQLFVHNKKSKHFLGVYDDVMATDQYSPLIIDLSPQARHSDYKLRANILPGQLPVIYELE
jgi:hypothetical protein